MSETKAFKEIENKVHEDLYNNLYLLKCIYKTSQEFDRVFKRDMFVKNNKAAFYEVVYYLLNILNPELTKEKLTTWPPFEIKRENKFRSELLKYINELNKFYQHAYIPLIMSSHLILPGGFKFTKFMLKLSQLVIYEHLKKKHVGLLLYSPMANKNANLTKEMLGNFNRVTHEIEVRIKDKTKKFQDYQNKQKNTATQLINNLKELDKNILASKKMQTAAEEDFYKKYTVYPSISSLQEKLSTLKQQWDKLAQIHLVFEECKSILKYLSTNNLVLEHNVALSINSSPENKLNLSQFFNTFGTLLNNKILDIPNPNSFYVQQSTEKLEDITDKCIQMQTDININKQQTRACIKDMFENLKYVDNLMKSYTKINADLSEDTLSGIKPFENNSTDE